MTLRQSHFVEPVPLVVARERGLLAGLDIGLERTRGSAAQLRGLLSGELDLVVSAIDNLFEWTAAGADVRLVAQMERTTPLHLYARPGLDALEALSGAGFAVDAYANGFSLIARKLFADAGIDVRYEEVGGVQERMEALLAGDVDATLLGPPFDLLAAEEGAVRVLDLSERFPELPGQGLIVRTELVRSPELLDYLRALVRAVRLAESLRTEAGVALMERAGFGAAAASHWGARPLSLDVEPRGLTFVSEVRRGLGLLRGAPLDELHDPEPMREARRGV
ncbi:ABC transporter substrate-binding protein [Leucobacter tenebrionis]|uniref:ABC transporter substrate-binding protein n=1 Tax=Leucobacter tenebrionis TaxID=2873270 RepID=UPI001CA6D7EE|nr:ABC transporter substrate-binding protein [Leucobacter tenebrionis]QZY50630.1 ABC transporter substrate-binding protein [Leucobacter tenebrionis]